MYDCTEEDLLISIEDAARIVTHEYGEEVTLSVLQKFGVSSIDALQPSDYEDAFSDLYLIANDN